MEFCLTCIPTNNGWNCRGANGNAAADGQAAQDQDQAQNANANQAQRRRLRDLYALYIDIQATSIRLFYFKMTDWKFQGLKYLELPVYLKSYSPYYY